MSLIEKIDAEIKDIRRIGREIDTKESLENARLITQGMEYAKQIILSEQKEPCEGCQYYGQYENEIEYGYPSPCTQCKRRCSDNYLNQTYTE